MWCTAGYIGEQFLYRRVDSILGRGVDGILVSDFQDCVCGNVNGKSTVERVSVRVQEFQAAPNSERAKCKHSFDCVWPVLFLLRFTGTAFTPYRVPSQKANIFLAGCTGPPQMVL